MGLAPLLLRPAPLWGFALPSGPPRDLGATADFPFADVRFKPQYPIQSPLEDVLRQVQPGSDSYMTEKYAFEIGALLQDWSASLRKSVHDSSALMVLLPGAMHASSLRSISETHVRASFGIDVTEYRFAAPEPVSREQFVVDVQQWLTSVAQVETAEFEVYGIDITGRSPLSLQLQIRYDIVALRRDGLREERTGSWDTTWSRDTAGAWRAVRWEAIQETRSAGPSIAFLDVTAQALDGTDSYRRQMLRGIDFWRTTLDAATGIDLYGNNGVAAGDYDNDGFDDFYVCQPAGLPNRLYRNRGDGTFEDTTEKAGVAVLDNTACALFADFQNRGLQDLLVVCGSGPLLFINQGDGTFRRKPDAFQFASAPQGTFTHAAVADYDGDGRLDIYCCTYSYYLGLDQYHYPVPYYDARNGPPNVLFHNRGDGTFIETTKAAGLDVDNNRYSFACAWGSESGTGLPDLAIANDFGISQLYRNNGDGTFTDVSGQSHIEDVGAGMSASWSDCDNDGRQDIYIASMWEASGQRVSEQPQFHATAPEAIRKLYQRHAQGNALYRNRGGGVFENIGKQAGVAMGRWSWSSDFWDFDHDGYADLYVANGYISGVEQDDLASFFWRQVVAKSPENSTPSLAYEHGWNAINELIRSGKSWNGHERNVMFANNRDGTFSEVSGITGLDFIEDSRAFALADIDHDGRLEVILKNRNAPQIRILHNAMHGIGGSIAFRLRGHKSNRDAIGASIMIEAGGIKQTRYLQTGSGFLSQHSKELFFGLGDAQAGVNATVRWPNGLVQRFESLPVNHRISIEEGVSTYAAAAFVASPQAYTHPATPPAPEPLPSEVQTWLVSPLKAPGFSLPDGAGNMHSLEDWRGHYVLLTFWSTAAPICRSQLQQLNQHRSAFAAHGIQAAAVNLDMPGDVPGARSIASSEHLQIPVLFATSEVGGIYNIIYRYLFDWRRDLGIPTSFLLDRDGFIVKLYQNQVKPEQVIADVNSVPKTASERMALALPFRGKLFQGEFQRNAFTFGVAMFQHGYLDEAAKSFQQVIADNPDDAEGYYNLGTLSLRRNNLAEARSYLEQTVKLRPDYPEAWNNLGMISAQQGHVDEAIADFQQALKLRPAYEVALLNLGNVYRRQRDFANAERCLTQALQLQPDDPDASYSFGMLNAQQNQLEAAADYLQRSIDLRPDSPEALNNLGIVYVRLHEDTKAEAQFKAAIRSAPGNDQAYLNLARLYVIHEDRQAAIRVLQDLLVVQPDNPAAKQALNELR